MTSQRTSQAKLTPTTQQSSAAVPNPSIQATSPTHPMLHLQRQMGNQATTSIIQTKLTVGEPNDVYEQEADRVAAEVVRKLQAPPQSTAQRKPQTTPQIQPLVQRAGGSTGGMAVAADVEAGIQQARSSGQPLPDGLRSSMEQAFGADFSGVRVHTGGESDRLNRSVEAKAFTTGQNIFFSQGAYDPGSRGGQELLVHELTHVVQQGGGTEPATIQRKISFAGYENASHAQLIDLFTDTLAALLKHKNFLESYFLTGQVEATSKHYLTYLRFSDIYYELTTFETFKKIIKLMKDSPHDYGNINLDNPQHLILLFKDAFEYLTAGNRYKDKEKDGQHLKAENAREQESWLKQKQESPIKGKNTFRVALLGTGASVADYLNAHRQQLDPEETIIIGKPQPWNPSNPEGRGITFVNHPRSMTSPLRQYTYLPQSKLRKYETFEGNAQQLTDDINKVMEPFPHQVNATIEKVSKEDSWYMIKTNYGSYTAKNVVSGLGIGPHKIPSNNLGKEIITPEDKEQEKRRVMDLDAFQRQLKDENSDIIKQSKQSQLTIGLSGPNAGVDAASTATTLGMQVLWMVSEDGPALAEGMGNSIDNRHLVTLYFDYLNGWKIQGSKVELSITGKWKKKSDIDLDPKQQRENRGKKFRADNKGWKISEADRETVDYLVYAPGPNVEKVWNIFDSSVTKDLTLEYDNQGRFGSHKMEQNESDNVSLKYSDENIRTDIQKRLETILGKGNKCVAATQNHLIGNAKMLLNVNKTFGSISLQEDVAIGLGSEDGSFQIIGGAAIRTLEHLDKLNKDNQRRNEVPEKLRGINKENAPAMRKVLETLSSPTILMNDQLTPIRSQIEAQGDYIPGYIGTEESNFVTDDQTMIAAQIASYYANIPPALANWVTQAIIQDRHKNGVKPGTREEGSYAFVNKWKHKLEALQNLFSRDNIKQVAEEQAR